MSKQKRPQTLETLVQKMPHQFQVARKEAGASHKLQQLVTEHLPQPLAEHVQVSSFHNGILSLNVDMPTWVMPLSMQRMALMQKLRRNGFPQLSSIKSQVKPQRAQQRNEQQRLKQEEQKPNPRRLSRHSAEELRALAERVDEPLKSQLLALCRLQK